MQVAIALPFALAGSVAAAQDAPLTLPAEALLTLATQAYLDGEAFGTALGTMLPSAQIRPHRVVPPIQDPFLWAFNGSFGAEGAVPIPGAIYSGARYGLAARDWFAENGFSSADSFTLMRQVLPLSDDAEVWPEGAVARLHCNFVWDDARAVAIMSEADTRRAFEGLFQTLTDQPAPPQLYGETGYRIDATEGAQDSVVQVESARMTLTLGHQELSFRSFLMGGGT